MIPIIWRRGREIKDSKGVFKLALTAIFVALTVVCSWISIPTLPPFTLQTFAVFSSILILGPGRAELSLFIYLILGGIGIPVFAGFNSGPAALLGPTGGYLFGFLLIAPIYKLFLLRGNNRAFIKFMGLLAGLLLCYILGAAWLVKFYSKTNEKVGFLAAFIQGGLVFILPDSVKIFLALSLENRLKKLLKV